MIYTKPANDIGWDDVDSFCQEGIPEGAHLDYKRDFPSNLEKTIAAMANTLGGVILIGVEEDDESKPKLPLRGVKFQKGLSERVTSIILSNVTPPVFPDIAVCRNSDGDKAVVVIRVPQSHQTPHAINRNTQVYLRTGNRNSPEDLARIDEIEWLREHRRKSEDLRDQIYRRAIDRFQVIHQREFDRLKSKNSKLEQRQEGVIETSICPLYPKDSLKDPPALREILSKMLVPEYYQSQYAYFPLPYDSVPKIMQDGISATMIDQYSDVYHTQLTTTGLFYYRQSAGTSEQGVGKVIYATAIFARLDQFLDSAEKFYQELGYSGPLQFRVVVKALDKVRLVDANTSIRDYCADPEVHFEDVVLSYALPEERDRLLLEAAQRICWAFNWPINDTELTEYYVRSKR